MIAAPVVVADELSETGEFLDGVVAIVNEGVVLKSQLSEQLEVISARAATQGIQLPPTEVMQEQILERLILSEIQLQRAERIGLNVSDEMLNRAIGNIAQENGVPFEDMPRLLAEDGIDYGEFRRQLREEITISNLRTIEVGESILSVNDREIDRLSETWHGPRLDLPMLPLDPGPGLIAALEERIEAELASDR